MRATRPFELTLVNIQDPGQERWKKKYVYWIPALHLQEREVAKGRWPDQVLFRNTEMKELLATLPPVGA